MDWNELKYLLAVARTGQAGLAATELNVSHATVSRKIADLEKRYGANLIDRSGLSWNVTPLGLQISKLAESIELCVIEANELVKDYGETLAGTVRISAPTIIITELLSDALDGFSKKYGNIKLDIVAQDNIADLRAREADIALRFTDNPDPSLYGEKIRRFNWSLFASADIRDTIVESLSTDKSALPNVPLLTSNPEDGFPAWAKGKFHPDCALNHVYGYREKASLAAKGFGVTLLPDLIGLSQSELIKIPQIECDRATQLWLLTNADVKNSSKIKAVKRYLLKSLKI